MKSSKLPKLSFFQSLFTHYKWEQKKIKDNLPLEDEDVSDVFNRIDGKKFKLVSSKIQHLGLKENCAKCYHHRENIGDYKNSLSTKGRIFLLVGLIFIVLGVIL